MIRRYEQNIKINMASAERDMKSDEDRRGFVIGAVLKLWEIYQEKQINGEQFNRLIGVLATFANGQYRNFINEQISAYKRGEPPTIIGY